MNERSLSINFEQCSFQPPIGQAKRKSRERREKHPKFRTLIADEWLLLINLGQNGHSYMK